MRPFRRLGLRLARIAYVRRAIVDEANLDPFRARPSVTLVIGVGLIGLSMLIGWPTVSLMGALAIYFREPLWAVIGGPLAYGLSWAVYGAGLLIAGKEALYYAGVFNRWLARKGTLGLIGKPTVDFPPEPEETGAGAAPDAASAEEIREETDRPPE